MTVCMEPLRFSGIQQRLFKPRSRITRNRKRHFGYATVSTRYISLKTIWNAAQRWRRSVPRTRNTRPRSNEADVVRRAIAHQRHEDRGGTAEALRPLVHRTRASHPKRHLHGDLVAVDVAEDWALPRAAGDPTFDLPQRCQARGAQLAPLGVGLIE